jgi:hypothetical protein
MSMEPTKNQLVEYFRNLAKLHQDVLEGNVSDEEYAERLAPLKAEHQFLIESGAFPLDEQVSLASQPQPTTTKKRSNSPHVLDFKCQCKMCVRKHTITMEDRLFLTKCGILWGKA